MCGTPLVTVTNQPGLKRDIQCGKMVLRCPKILKLLYKMPDSTVIYILSIHICMHISIACWVLLNMSEENFFSVLFSAGSNFIIRPQSSLNPSRCGRHRCVAYTRQQVNYREQPLTNMCCMCVCLCWAAYN